MQPHYKTKKTEPRFGLFCCFQKFGSVVAGARPATRACTFAVFMAMALSIGAIDCKPRAPHRVIDKVNRCAAQVINGYLVDHNFDTIGFKGGIHIAEIIVERHAKIYA